MAAGYEFSVGEKVAFVDEDIKGVVKSVSGEKVVITTSDGFEYECSPREIVSQEIAEKGLSDFIKDKDWQERRNAGISAEPAVLYHHHAGDFPDLDPYDVHEREQDGGSGCTGTH